MVMSPWDLVKMSSCCVVQSICFFRAHAGVGSDGVVWQNGGVFKVTAVQRRPPDNAGFNCSSCSCILGFQLFTHQLSVAQTSGV